MSFPRWAAALVVASVVTGALVGCSPKSVADGVLPFPDAIFDVLGPDDFGGESAYWQQPNRLVVIVGGSSSCPQVVTHVEEADRRAILTFEEAGGPICTMDLTQSAQYFILKNGRPDHVTMKDGSRTWRLGVVDIER